MSNGPFTKQLAVSLSLTNYIAQIPAGAAIDTSGPFTDFEPTRLPQITLGAGGGAVTYTLTGTDIVTGEEFSQTIVFTVPATKKADKPMRITRLQSDVDPAGTTDLQAGDTWVNPACRGLRVGVAGDIACRPMENESDVTIPVLAGVDPSRLKIIRITGTTAANIVIGW